MNLALTLWNYVVWHYTRAFVDIFRVWVNFMWFITHFFSMKLLLFTLFAPFMRLQEKRSKQFSFIDLFEVIVINIMMRILGIVLRTLTLAIGLVVLAITFVLGIATFGIWIFAPILWVYLIITGFGMLAK